MYIQSISTDLLKDRNKKMINMKECFSISKGVLKNGQKIFISFFEGGHFAMKNPVMRTTISIRWMCRVD